MVEWSSGDEVAGSDKEEVEGAVTYFGDWTLPQSRRAD
jgi:hypothetical protein